MINFDDDKSTKEVMSFLVAWSIMCLNVGKKTPQESFALAEEFIKEAESRYGPIT